MRPPVRSWASKIYFLMLAHFCESRFFAIFSGTPELGKTPRYPGGTAQGEPPRSLASCGFVRAVTDAFFVPCNNAWDFQSFQKSATYAPRCDRMYPRQRKFFSWQPFKGCLRGNMRRTDLVAPGKPQQTSSSRAEFQDRHRQRFLTKKRSNRKTFAG
jgi:hypothetical protein